MGEKAGLKVKGLMRCPDCGGPLKPVYALPDGTVFMQCVKGHRVWTGQYLLRRRKLVKPVYMFKPEAV
jgi:hypothetical protein